MVTNEKETAWLLRLFYVNLQPFKENAALGVCVQKKCFSAVFPFDC